MSTICIYHGNCADGFGAAWAVRKALPDCEFHAGIYQNTPPDVAGRDVVIVDFSYKRGVVSRHREGVDRARRRAHGMHCVCTARRSATAAR